MEQALKIVPPPSIPMAVARALVKSFFSTATEVFTLRAHRGHFYKWNGQHWAAMDTNDVRGEVYRQLEHAKYEHPKKGMLSFAPSQGKINNVVDALRAIVELDANVESTCWTDGASVDRPPANEIVSVANGPPPCPDSHPETPTLRIFSATTRLSLPTLPMLILRRGGSNSWASCGIVTSRPSTRSKRRWGTSSAAARACRRCSWWSGPSVPERAPSGGFSPACSALTASLGRLLQVSPRTSGCLL